MGRMVRLAAGIGGALLLATPTVAPAKVPAREEPREYEVGAGALFYLGSSFIDEPLDKTYPEGFQFPNYDGMAGKPSPSGGLAAEFRYKGVIGLEIDLIFATDKAQTEFETLTFQVEQSALHLPILVKAMIPAGLVRPGLFIGPEFVFPDSPSATYSPEQPGLDVKATAESYMLWTTGLAFEFALPIDDVDLRIPLMLRASFNPSPSDKAEDSLDFEFQNGAPTAIVFKTQYEYQAAVTLGLMYHFL